MKSRSDRELPLFAAPQHTESPTLVSLIFPCNAIQLFSPSPRSREPLKAGDLGIYEGKEQSLGNVHCRPGSCRGGAGRGGAGHFTFTQPTLDGVIQPLEGPKTFPATMMTHEVAACRAQPASKTSKFTQCFAPLVFSSDFEPRNLSATTKKKYA